jgi:glutathione S-transferase
MAGNNTIRLFDLVLANGCTISPFVWRTKYALKHKGFDIDLVPNGFTGIKQLTEGRSDRLPVIVDDGEWVIDSWKIAEYLDLYGGLGRHPSLHTLFGLPRPAAG